MPEKVLIPTQNQALDSSLSPGLIANWLDHEHRTNGASDNTLQAYGRSLAIFRDWLDAHGLSLGQVTPVDVVDFKADQAQHYSAQTVNLGLTAIRSFYRFLVTTGRAALNPAGEVKGVKRSKSRTHKRDALTNGEVAHVLSRPNPGSLAGLRDRAILVLLAYCALRSVEIHRANLGDLHTRGDRLTLDVRGKGRTEADEYVVIPLDQEPIIRVWLQRRLTVDPAAPGDPLFISLSNRTRGRRLALRSLRELVKSYYAQAGVVGHTKSTHSLRHSAITNAIRQGAQPLQVQAMARHQSFETTLNYYHQVSRLDEPAEDLIDYG